MDCDKKGPSDHIFGEGVRKMIIHFSRDQGGKKASDTLYIIWDRIMGREEGRVVVGQNIFNFLLIRGEFVISFTETDYAIFFFGGPRQICGKISYYNPLNSTSCSSLFVFNRLPLSAEAFPEKLPG